jgi:hypothetical protein
MATNTMDAIKKKMQAMKCEKDNALEKADQLEQRVAEQKAINEKVSRMDWQAQSIRRFTCVNPDWLLLCIYKINIQWDMLSVRRMTNDGTKIVGSSSGCRSVIRWQRLIERISASVANFADHTKCKSSFRRLRPFNPCLFILNLQSCVRNVVHFTVCQPAITHLILSTFVHV